MKRRTPIETRFWRQLMPAGDCLVWTGAVDRLGYAALSLGGAGARWVGAHRFAWTMAHGPIPKGLEVCHTCDIRSCVRVDHLFLGTHAQNMADMASKGRAATGARHNCAKLTFDDILAIRADTRQHKVLALEYGVAPSTIRRARSGSHRIFRDTELVTVGDKRFARYTLRVEPVQMAMAL